MYLLRRFCNRDVRLLVIRIRLYYLLREFTSVIAITVYIPPSGKADVVISSVTAPLQTKHLGAFILITRDNRKLDLFYTNVRDTYTFTTLSPLGRSDHNLLSCSHQHTNDCYPNNKPWVTNNLKGILNELRLQCFVSERLNSNTVHPGNCAVPFPLHQLYD